MWLSWRAERGMISLANADGSRVACSRRGARREKIVVVREKLQHLRTAVGGLHELGGEDEDAKSTTWEGARAGARV